MHDFNPSGRAPGHVRAAMLWLVVALAGLVARLASPAWRTDGALVCAGAGLVGLAFALAALARADGLHEPERSRVVRRAKVLAGALALTLAALGLAGLTGRAG